MKTPPPLSRTSLHMAIMSSAIAFVNPAAASDTITSQSNPMSPRTRAAIDLRSSKSTISSSRPDPVTSKDVNVANKAAAPTGQLPAKSRLKRISTVNRAATLRPENAAFRHALEILPFTEGAIYEIYAAPERITDIQLQPGEILVSVASGDTARWIIGDTSSGTGEDKQVHILIKPFAANLATNILITTDRRTYHLNLKSNSHIATAAVSWIYPANGLVVLKGTSPLLPSGTASAGVRPDRLNFGYTISGARPRWRPVRAYDDGQKTYIEFPPGIDTDEAPPLFLINDNEAQLVNYRMQGRFYIVDRLFDRAELRLGTRRAIVVGIHRADEPARSSSRP